MVSSTSPKNGFTLLEMVFAMGIFVLLLLVITAVYGRFVSAQRLGISQQEMQEDVRLILQLINREARTAYGNTYEETNSPPGIAFRNQEGQCVHYKFEAADNSIMRAEASGAAPPGAAPPSCRDTSVVIYAQYRRLNDKQNTIIEQLKFSAIKADADLQVRQGLTTVYLSVHPAADPTQTMHLQSTVTSRQFTSY